MSKDSRDSARSVIQARFQDAVDRDVSGLAARYCQEQGLRTPEGFPAEHLCIGSHAAVTRLIWQDFSPGWEEVVYVYDGTRSEQARYLNAKLNLTVTLAAAGDEPTPEVQAALRRAEHTLHALWLAWAGYQATTTDALAHAVTEFEDAL
ncbi:hypothetical protein DAETH_15340 [Deinococcus aetherius]|uniref:Uncharacterized protein n=1 Tax=Deinococcus aetherius TaxID=200252 RepID=A0ABM8ACR4_9DEIO|nr:hypothetical protein [Deinococcus aetherius]BDP41565.1 hypothetical protein DAETH_15340 [Deinococcus aetherius]